MTQMDSCPLVGPDRVSRMPPLDVTSVIQRLSPPQPLHSNTSVPVPVSQKYGVPCTEYQLWLVAWWCASGPLPVPWHNALFEYRPLAGRLPVQVPVPVVRGGTGTLPERWVYFVISSRLPAVTSGPPVAEGHVTNHKELECKLTVLVNALI